MDRNGLGMLTQWLLLAPEVTPKEQMEGKEGK